MGIRGARLCAYGQNLLLFIFVFCPKVLELLFSYAIALNYQRGFGKAACVPGRRRTDG
jgi:hypothetical protein